MRRNRLARLTGALLAATLLFAGCLNPFDSGGGNEDPATTGTLTLSVSDGISAQTLLPDLDMNVAAYQIDGTGPGGESFSVSIDQTTVTVESLAFGEWSVAVSALNGDDVVIGNGSTTVMVNTGETSTASVTVTPIDGIGTLDLLVDWNDGDIQTPSIDAALTPATGATVDLGFTVDGSSASYSSNTIATGYHTLALQLLDNGLVTAGAVEVVRIAAGATTRGSYLFDQVNKPGGTIDVEITPEMAEPLTVAISGEQSTVELGQSLGLAASVAEPVSAVYVWYVNGSSVATGESFTFSADGYGLGYYRIDVTAFSADGTRAGSASVSTEVLENSGTSSQGVLDTGFGQNGLVSSVPGLGLALAMQDDGKIIQVGGSYPYARVARYLPDGALDTSFGAGGVVDSSLSNGRYSSVAVQPDGKIVAAGFYGFDTFGARRYLPDGTIDNSFGQNGLVSGDISGYCYGVTLQPDGKIILSGHRPTGAGSFDAAMIRYLPDGTVDTGFGMNGIAVLDFGVVTDGYDSAMAGAVVLPDGKILLAGWTQDGTDNQSNRAFAIARFTEAGALDPSFGESGKTVVSLGLDKAEGRGIAVDSQGRIVVAGNANVVSGGQYTAYAAIRLLADGQLDSTFGNAGSVVIPVGSGDMFSGYASAVAVLPDDTIALLGHSDDLGYRSLQVEYLEENGDSKTAVGDNGKIIVDFGFETLPGFGQAVQLQEDGRLLVSGYANGAPNTFVLARLD